MNCVNLLFRRPFIIFTLMNTTPHTHDTSLSIIEHEHTAPRSNITNAPKSAIHQTLYSAAGITRHDYLPEKEQQPLHLITPSAGEINWLHVVGINNTALLRQLLQPYGIHELVIEDILSHRQRPKIEDYGDYVFIASQVYHYTTQRLHSDQVYLIVGKDFVLSFQQKPLGLFSHLRERMDTNPNNLLEKNAAFLAYYLLDRIVDDYFIVLEEYNNRVETMDKTVFKDDGGEGTLGKIHRLKRDAIRLRRTLIPMRDVFYQLAARNEFAVFAGEPALYLRDVYDHIMQVIESLDASRDMIMSMMDVYLSFQSNRMNRQMRVLTVITLIFMPLTVLTGIYGMNFDHMPELHWPYGYYMVLSLMAVIIIGLLIFFFKRKWL